MRSGYDSLLALALGACLLSCGPSLKDRRFEPGPLSAERLVDAAASVGLLAREVTAEIPPAARSGLKFTCFDYDDPYLATLRSKYKLEEVVAPAGDEWKAQLLLQKWVHERIPGGNPTVEARNALDILEYAAQGKKFYCTYYAITYVECAQALGWQARKIGVDRYHGPDSSGSTHHGVAEVWSDKFRKWVVIDPQSNLHFEKNGVPLSAWEIRAEWLKNHGKEVDHVVGVPPDAVNKNPAILWWNRPDEDETACYFWVYVADNSTGWSEEGTCRFIFPQDSVNRSLTWYQNDGGNKKSRLHTGYLKKLFLNTDRIEDAYWSVGVVEASLDSASGKSLFLSLDSYCPNRDGYEVSFDGDNWRPVENESSLEWPLKKGPNLLALRTESRGNVKGPDLRVRMLVE